MKGFLTMKFEKGEHVLYAKTGVCLIEDIKTCEFLNKDQLYYILKPVANKGSTVYVPFDSNLTQDMHPLVTASEVDEILNDIKGKQIEWIEAKNERTEYFNSIISEGDRQKLVLLIHCIYSKKLEKLDEKKHLSAADEAILKTAEKLIDEEFSFAIGCSENKVGEYIRLKLGINE